MGLIWNYKLTKNFCGSTRLKIIHLSLAGVAQWIKLRPANQKVTCLIPSQGTCLGCGPGPQLETWETQLICVSLPDFLPSPVSKSK